MKTSKWLRQGEKETESGEKGGMLWKMGLRRLKREKYVFWTDSKSPILQNLIPLIGFLCLLISFKPGNTAFCNSSSSEPQVFRDAYFDINGSGSWSDVLDMVATNNEIYLCTWYGYQYKIAHNMSIIWVNDFSHDSWSLSLSSDLSFLIVGARTSNGILAKVNTTNGAIL